MGHPTLPLIGALGEGAGLAAALCRPRDLAGVDAYLRPIVRAVVGLPAPVDGDPMITAVK